MKAQYRPDIEGLRGVAILLVIAYHAGVTYCSGGYIGVDVFFVLSGYLITELLVREAETTGKIDLIGFYARRARRLLPALALVLLATMAAVYVLYVPFEQAGIANTSVATATYVSNLHFAWQSTNYLLGGAETNPLLHTWSLSVEEQFYLGWPLLILLTTKFIARRRDFGSQRTRLLVVMVVLALTSLGLSILLTRYRQPWAFFSSPTRAWEFAVGGVGALTAFGLRGRALGVAGWFGLFLLGATAVFYDEATVFPGVAAIVPVLGTLLILQAGTLSLGGVGKFLSARWLQWVGRLSYSWYLWHWPVLILAGRVLGPLNPAARLSGVVLSLGLAAASYHLVETPVRYNRLLLRRSVYSLAMAAALTVLGVGASYVWRNAAAVAAKSPGQAQFTEARQDLPALLYQRDCILDLAGSDLKKCYFGVEGASTTVVLFGDSHAAQWFPALNSIAETKGWGLIPLVKSACPVADVIIVHHQLKRRYVECEQWRANALRMIGEMRPTYIVMTNMEGYTDTVEWAAGFGRTLSALSDTGAKIIYLRDTPKPGFDVPACLARAAWRPLLSAPTTCTFLRESGISDEQFEADRRVLLGYPNVRLVDMTPFICPNAKCEPQRGEYVIYKDGDHLTSRFIVSLSAALKEEIDRAINGMPLTAVANTDATSQSGF